MIAIMPGLRDTLHRIGDNPPKVDSALVQLPLDEGRFVSPIPLSDRKRAEGRGTERVAGRDDGK